MASENYDSSDFSAFMEESFVRRWSDEGRCDLIHKEKDCSIEPSVLFLNQEDAGDDDRNDQLIAAHRRTKFDAESGGTAG
jgi:hypothetical protein